MCWSPPMTPLSPPTQRILIQEPRTKLRKLDCVAWKICPSFSSIAGTHPKAARGGGGFLWLTTFWSWSTGEGSWDRNSIRAGSWRQEPKHRSRRNFPLLTSFRCFAPPTILQNADPPAQLWHHLWWTGPATLIISQDNAPQACLSASLMEAFSQWRFPSHVLPAWIGLTKSKATPKPTMWF